MSVEGSWVGWIEGDEARWGRVLRKLGRKLVVRDPRGRERSLPASKVRWVVEDGSTEDDPEARTAAQAPEVDVAALWEILREDRGPWTDARLAELALGTGDPAAQVAVARALLADGLHFELRREGWLARRTEEVRRRRDERAQRRRQEAEREAALIDLVRRIRGEAPTGDPGADASLRPWVDALRQVALEGEGAPRRALQAARKVLERAGLPHESVAEGAFRCLRALGVFEHDDVNLAILRHGLRTGFPQAVEDEARRKAACGAALDGREDLTALDVVTVDSPRTRELDDALSLEAREDGSFRAGVHIADPAAFVEPGSAVDQEAYARGCTYYFPDQRLPMLPPVLSEEAASLKAGLARPAVSFLAELSPEGEILSYRIVRSVVRVRARLSYAEAEAWMGEKGTVLGRMLQGWDRLARLREALRVRRGAVRLALPEADVYVEPGGVVRLERVDPNSPSRRMVSEAMVLAGELAARTAVRSQIPVIFRRQDPPADPLPERGPDEPEWLHAWRARRQMPRAEISIHPGPHHGLGLDAYAQATSPLRRYQDLATHRQLLSHLEGNPFPYDTARLAEIAATTELVEREGRRAEAEAEHYWKLRFLESFVGREVEAWVTEAGRRPRVWLKQTLLEAVVPGLAGVQPGDTVQLRVEAVRPRAGVVILRPAKETAA